MALDADAADADHDDVSPGLDLGGVDRRAPAGDDAAAEQAGPVERESLSILMQLASLTTVWWANVPSVQIAS